MTFHKNNDHISKNFKTYALKRCWIYVEKFCNDIYNWNKKQKKKKQIEQWLNKFHVMEYYTTIKNYIFQKHLITWQNSDDRKCEK